MERDREEWGGRGERARELGQRRTGFNSEAKENQVLRTLDPDLLVSERYSFLLNFRNVQPHSF